VALSGTTDASYDVRCLGCCLRERPWDGLHRRWGLRRRLAAPGDRHERDECDQRVCAYGLSISIDVRAGGTGSSSAAAASTGTAATHMPLMTATAPASGQQAQRCAAPRFRFPHSILPRPYKQDHRLPRRTNAVHIHSHYHQNRNPFHTFLHDVLPQRQLRFVSLFAIELCRSSIGLVVQTVVTPTARAATRAAWTRTTSVRPAPVA
jgi:hypothetical protein